MPTTGSTPTTPPPTGTRRGSTRPTGPVLAVLFLVIAIVAACGSDDSSQGTTPTFSYVIPAGAGLDIENGKPLDILPRELVAQLDETIQIVNDDDRAHLLGPWFVGAGETLRQRFTEAGVFEGSCSVHPSGEFTVIVEE